MKNLFYGKNTHLLIGHMLQVHIGIASMRQFQCVPTTYVTEFKETYNEIYTKQSFIEWSYVVGTHCLYVTEIKETYFEIYT